ncbi:GNAT family N-acetyltransferase [Nocardiopsis xinjiangensis]|uniref:GNAT family N-acetyltransferase n=1 Tax=Nocardiopsis xinjiangensis TaxID=124285 RepID=UPI001376A606|nr:GNAT family protein [Nocardiopsis xinjiangensis]
MIFPHTTSRRLIFRPASVADHKGFFDTLLRQGFESFRPADLPTRSLLRSLDTVFVVIHRSTGDELGFSALYGHDQAGHMRCGLYLDKDRLHLGVGSEAVFLTVNYAFAMFRVDRLITQTTEASSASFGLSFSQSDKDGVLSDHLYFRGRPWDLHTFHIDRADWEALIDTDLAGVLPTSMNWREAPSEPPETEPGVLSRAAPKPSEAARAETPESEPSDDG